MTEPMTVVGASGNRPHGHIAIGHTEPVATLVDLGDGRLHWWAYSKGDIDAAGARALAAELTAWAKRDDERRRSEPLPGQGDLFSEAQE